MAVISPLVYSVDEVATACRVSRRTIFSWTRDRGMPHVRIGSRVLYPVDRLRGWIEQHAASTPDMEGGE